MSWRSEPYFAPCLENYLKSLFYYVKIVCMFVGMNAPVCQFLFSLFPLHSSQVTVITVLGMTQASADSAQQESVKTPRTWKQRIQFLLVEWVPFCWFDQFPSKYVLPRKVPSLNSRPKTFQSKLQHSISLYLEDISNDFQTLASLGWYILKLIYAAGMPTKSHCIQLLSLQAKVVSGRNLAQELQGASALAGWTASLFHDFYIVFTLFMIFAFILISKLH